MGQHLDVPGCRRNSRDELSPQPLSQHGAELKSDLAQRQKTHMLGEWTNRCWGVISVTFMKINSTWKILGEVSKREDYIICILCKVFFRKAS